MSRSKWLLLLGVALFGLVSSGEASAHRRWHGHVGVYAGPHWVDPWYEPPMYRYRYPPLVVVPAPPPAPPPVYIERGAAPPAGQPQRDSWYYCTNPQGYYPDVRECPGGWLQVAPTLPSRP